MQITGCWDTMHSSIWRSFLGQTATDAKDGSSSKLESGDLEALAKGGKAMLRSSWATLQPWSSVNWPL